MISEPKGGTPHDIPSTAFRDMALRKERLPDKDKGNKNDEHQPEGTNPTPGGSEWSENLFTGGDWRVSANAWAGFGLRLLLIFATLFSVVQFLAARQEMRVQRTLDIVEMWERPEYQEAQRAVKVRLADLNEKNAALLGKDPTKQELDYYFKQIGIAAMTASGGAMPLSQFEEHFDRVVYFLNRLSHCVSGNLCNGDIADDYFHEYAVSFWNYFSGYIENQRKGGAANFAKPIEEFVQRGQAEAGTR